LREPIYGRLGRYGFLRQTVRVSRIDSITVRDSLSVSLTVGAYGVAFGAASVANGFSVLQSCLLSLLTFSGASQFAVVGVIGAGGTALSAIATASLLGVRNGLYGVIMAPRLHVKGFKRIVAAQITIDESTAVSLGAEGRNPDSARHGFWLTGAGVFIFWNLFTLAGALGAQAMGDTRAWGLDSAVPAAFLGLVWPRLKSNRDRALAVVSVIFALAMTPILPPGLPIIATAFIAIAVGLRR
jgi:predicted branched-subunit amino acid permease